MIQKPQHQQQSRSFWSYLWPSANSSSKSSNSSVSSVADGRRHDGVDDNGAAVNITQQTEWTDTFDYSGCELTIQSSNNFPLSKDKESSSKMSLR